jgi:hypothetical protein
VRTLESILRAVPRPLPSVAAARAAWRSFRAINGYKGEAKLIGAPDSNTKLSKGDKAIYGLTLIPHTAAGINVCPFATDGCARACVLMTAGRGVMSNVRKARTVKTQFAAEYPAEFLALLLSELSVIANKGNAIVRLNVASDVRWEFVIPEAFELSVSFYDYTKWPTDKREPAANYRIVYSRNERDGDEPATDYLTNGGNVAVVFADMPEQWYGFPVINGDSHDDRTSEPAGTVIGLSAKGLAKNDLSGFVV